MKEGFDFVLKTDRWEFQIEVIGRLLANDARMGKVTYTIQDPQDGSIQFCTVEQLAIHHYQTEQDYTFGNIIVHSEPSVGHQRV